jgi:hypothetical protein
MQKSAVRPLPCVSKKNAQQKLCCVFFPFAMRSECTTNNRFPVVTGELGAGRRGEQMIDNGRKS